MSLPSVVGIDMRAVLGSVLILAGAVSIATAQEETTDEVLEAQGPAIQLAPAPQLMPAPGLGESAPPLAGADVLPLSPLEMGSEPLWAPELSEEGEDLAATEETLAEQAEEGTEAAPAESSAEVTPVAAPIGEVVGVGQFGHYELRSLPRPYSFLSPSELDKDQRATVASWERSPFYLVWVYDVTPTRENNWAGWGPPPPGCRDRNEFVRRPDGSLIGEGNPWPPYGDYDPGVRVPC